MALIRLNKYGERKATSIFNISVDSGILFGILLCLALPLYCYFTARNSIELYTSGKLTNGYVTESHYVRTKRHNPFASEYETNLVTDIQYLNSRTTFISQSPDHAPYHAGQKITLLYSPRNPNLVIKYEGEARSFWRIFDEVGNTWAFIFCLILTPVSWSYVLSEVKKFRSNLKELNEDKRNNLEQQLSKEQLIELQRLNELTQKKNK